MAEERNGGCEREACNVSARVRPSAAVMSTDSGVSGLTAASIFVRAASTVSMAGAEAARSSGIRSDPALAFLKAGNDLDDRARPVATVELRGDQPVPAIAARPIRSGQGVDHGAPRQTCAGPRLQRGDADGLVRDKMKEHREALELLLEELPHRLRRHVAPREPSP